MCDKCEDLDEKIAHYRRLQNSITDELTLTGIKRLIEEASAEKVAFHPEEHG